MTQLITPQAPPAIATAPGGVGEDSPWYLTRSCFKLSYVMKYTDVPTVSRTSWNMSARDLCMVQGKGFPLGIWHTHMQAEARPETKHPTLLDDLSRRFDGPFALVVMADSVVAPGRVFFRHQSRVLCRVLHQFERAYSYFSSRTIRKGVITNIHAMNVDRQPDKAPAAPKHSSVAGVGVLPGLLTVTSGSSIPVAFPIADEKVYLAFWYTEKPTVRTRVTLPRGARNPGGMMQDISEKFHSYIYKFRYNQIVVHERR